VAAALAQARAELLEHLNLDTEGTRS
jgi:hypothetical protein